jgi:hypothetical protein
MSGVSLRRSRGMLGAILGRLAMTASALRIYLPIHDGEPSRCSRTSMGNTQFGRPLPALLLPLL